MLPHFLEAKIRKTLVLAKIEILNVSSFIPPPTPFELSIDPLYSIYMQTISP